MLCAMLAAQSLAAQSPLLQHLIGRWSMTGTIRGKPVTYTLVVTPTLRRHYVELHMTDAATPSTYEARVFIGPDTLPGHYLAHWLDAFGAAYSVPTATGEAHSDTLTLDFPYSTGAFHDTFAYDSVHDAWSVRLDKADGHGGSTVFGDYHATRLPR